MSEKRTRLWDLYLSFCKIGGLTFGGGLAMLPMLQREVVAKHGWATEEELLDIYAIGQCTPGIIAVNTATMIGFCKRGVLGAITATLGMVTPSLIIITLLASVLMRIEDNVYFQRAFSGIRVAVCALVANSVMGLAKKSLVDTPTWLFYLVVVVATLIIGISPIALIFAGILYGLLVKLLQRRKTA